MRDRNRAPATTAAPTQPGRTHAASTDELLTRIADRLTGNLPERAMREVNRLAYALVYADHEHGYRTTMSLATEQELLRRMPRVDGQTITRGEYALQLRLCVSTRSTMHAPVGDA